MFELDLPIELIQHVQSFLDGEEAARTCLLSKSWYHAWSTRPILFFKYDEYPYVRDAQFWNYVRKTMTRYKQLNLKLQKLELVLDYDNHVADYSSRELFADASSLGVTELDLNMDYSALGLHKQIFAIKSLTKLSLNAKYPSFLDLDDGDVLCSSLVSLYLHDDLGDESLEQILLGCPLIQTLALKYNPDWSESSKFGWLDSEPESGPESCPGLCPRLVSLTFHNSTFHNGLDHLLRDILFRSPLLTSLRFYRVDDIADGDILNIFSKSTLVESLDMEECDGISRIDVSELDNLVHLSIKDCRGAQDKSTRVIFGSINLLEFQRYVFLKKVANYVHEFHKLRSVFLEKVEFEPAFFTNFSSKFPVLEDLTLDRCNCYRFGFDLTFDGNDYTCVQISSQSLKYLKLIEVDWWRKAEFDLPNICKVVLKLRDCIFLPDFSFTTTSREWECEVNFARSKSLPVGF